MLVNCIRCQLHLRWNRKIIKFELARWSSLSVPTRPSPSVTVFIIINNNNINHLKTFLSWGAISQLRVEHRVGACMHRCVSGVMQRRRWLWLYRRQYRSSAAIQTGRFERATGFSFDPLLLLYFHCYCN